MSPVRPPTPRLAVRDAPLRAPLELPLDATIGDVARTLVRERAPALLLGEGQAIVTEHDVVRAVAQGRAPDEPAADIATPDPVAVTGDAAVLEAIELMLRHGLRALVVVDREGRPYGMLTLVAAVEAFLGLAEVPPWLVGLRLALRVDVER